MVNKNLRVINKRRDLGTRDGRPPYQPSAKDREYVERLVATGHTQAQAATIMKISVNTLRKYFPDELDVAAIKANEAVGSIAFLRATGGPARDWTKASDTQIIWWLKCRAGWRESPIEITTPDGRPLQIEGGSARELIASRIASIAANLRAEGDLGQPDGGTALSPPVGLEILPPAGADAPRGSLVDMADPSGPGVRKDEVGS
jgi:hypothetical protein